jgi:hypothetical protein
MTYQELCERILLEAQRGGERAEQANLNTQSVIEAIMPSVLQDVALKFARDEEGRSLLRQTHTITLTDGVGVVPAAVLTQCKWGASIADPADVTVAQLQSFVAYWQDFVQPRSGLEADIPLWTIKGNDEFHYLEAGEDYDPADGFDGDVELTIATVPSIPASAADQTGWPSEFESDVIDYGAEMLRGMKIAV